MKIGKTRLNFTIAEYQQNEGYIKALDFKTSGDDIMKIEINQHSRGLNETIESRENDEVLFVVFAIDLKCHSSSSFYGASFE